jgi:hypothetical protein
MTRKTKPKRLYHHRRRLLLEEQRMRRCYTRIYRVQGAAKVFLRIGHQEFEICECTSPVRANWFADQLAIALARLVVLETGAKL